jgi:hypothetical protein
MMLDSATYIICNHTKQDTNVHVVFTRLRTFALLILADFFARSSEPAALGSCSLRPVRRRWAAIHSNIAPASRVVLISIVPPLGDPLR